jgi:hypothetical protein
VRCTLFLLVAGGDSEPFESEPERSRTFSSGAKAHRLAGLYVGAKAPTPKAEIEPAGPLRYFFCGAFEEFVDQSLIGLGLLGGEAAKLGEEAPTCFTCASKG